MINIPYTGLVPALNPVPRLPVMEMPVHRGSVAERNAASVLSLQPPPLPDPGGILGQIASGAAQTSQLLNLLSPQQAPLPALQVLMPGQSAPVPGIATPGNAYFPGAVLAGGTLQSAPTSVTITPPNIPARGGLLGWLGREFS